MMPLRPELELLLLVPIGAVLGGVSREAVATASNPTSRAPLREP